MGDLKAACVKLSGSATRPLRGLLRLGTASPAGDAARQHSVDKQVAQSDGFPMLLLPGQLVRGCGTWPLGAEVFEGAWSPNLEGLRLNEVDGLEVFPATFRWTAFVQGDGQQFEDAVTVVPWTLRRSQGHAIGTVLRPPIAFQEICTFPFRVCAKKDLPLTGMSANVVHLPNIDDQGFARGRLFRGQPLCFLRRKDGAMEPWLAPADLTILVARPGPLFFARVDVPPEDAEKIVSNLQKNAAQADIDPYVCPCAPLSQLSEVRSLGSRQALGTQAEGLREALLLRLGVSASLWTHRRPEAHQGTAAALRLLSGELQADKLLALCEVLGYWPDVPLFEDRTALAGPRACVLPLRCHTLSCKAPSALLVACSGDNQPHRNKPGIARAGKMEEVLLRFIRSQGFDRSDPPQKRLSLPSATYENLQENLRFQTRVSKRRRLALKLIGVNVKQSHDDEDSNDRDDEDSDNDIA